MSSLSVPSAVFHGRRKKQAEHAAMGYVYLNTGRLGLAGLTLAVLGSRCQTTLLRHHLCPLTRRHTPRMCPPFCTRSSLLASSKPMPTPPTGRPTAASERCPAQFLHRTRPPDRRICWRTAVSTRRKARSARWGTLLPKKRAVRRRRRKRSMMAQVAKPPTARLARGTEALERMEMERLRRKRRRRRTRMSHQSADAI